MLGAIWIAGWPFGMSQSTCVIVFIGISVDYVVHISHEYIHSGQLNRYDRTVAAYR
jgi:predicted RND superfamily exporter protein